MRRFAAFGSVLVLGLSCVTGHVLAADLAVGDMAPEFELKGSDGKTYRSSDFKGKCPIVLCWFPKAFTGG
jgi:peroxiredoxin Q/BCP